MGTWHLRTAGFGAGSGESPMFAPFGDVHKCVWGRGTGIWARKRGDLQGSSAT